LKFNTLFELKDILKPLHKANSTLRIRGKAGSGVSSFSPGPGYPLHRFFKGEAQGTLFVSSFPSSLLFME
jgi:hypothetical protein